MRKLTFAFAVLASLGGASLATSASAAPGVPMGVTAPDAVTTTVQMRRMERRMERRMMERRMMRRQMMKRRMMRRM
ncbi:hypothetical protein [uncultured Methylobacterium sp.]|uniref:hypothetical protein n=1 Tax=uncultured Methylobacterium sp. TaxID=157278 RepID=UPI0035CBF55F